ncbi:MAG: transposase, partial [Krumholzibacteria bacterium]|nr:transposase [Candidatus Krumholzibacteria bacterium]
QVEYTISVPFERLPELKGMIEQRERWRRIDEVWSCFEAVWKPKDWLQAVRCVFVRQRSPRRRSGPLQLDLFEPRSAEHTYKVIMTNKRCSAKSVMLYHHGRGSQEGIIGEAKESAMMDYVPTRSWAGNQFYMLASLTAHNVTRELQMRTAPRRRGTNPKRAALWLFEKLETVRNRTIRRAGRLHRPDGALTLTMSRNEAVQADYDRIMRGLEQAA